MNKYFILICIIFLINIVSASPLLSNPTSLNIDVIKGETKTIYLNITNYNNYTFTDIKIEGEFISSSIINSLSFNQTKQITLNLNVPTQGNFIKVLKVIGFTSVNCSVLQSETKDIFIYSSGSAPNDIEICKSSNIKFTNYYGNSVRVVIDNFSVDALLANGSSHVQNYANTGNFIYRIEPLIDLGYVNVVDTSQKVHDNNDDGIINLNVNSVLQETSIELQFNRLNFTMQHNQIVNSFFIIKNLGNIQAEKIMFFGDWLTFDKNNLNINGNDERAVNFVISPMIIDSLQTNRTYIKTIIITGDNILRLEYNLTIFVEQSTIVSGNISSPEWWIKRKAFCDAFPTSPDCITEPQIIFRDKEIFNCPDILANVSPKHVQESLQECNNLRGDFSQFSNNVKLDLDSLKGTALQTLGLNGTIASVGDEVNSFSNVFYFVFGIIFLSAIVLGISYVAMLYYKARKLKMVTTI